MIVINYLRALFSKIPPWSLHKDSMAVRKLPFLSFRKSLKLLILYKLLIITPPPHLQAGEKHLMCGRW